MDDTDPKQGSRKFRRHSLRLSTHDYKEPAAYLVTIVTQGRECLFGEVSSHTVELNHAGAMVREVWNGLPTIFSNVAIDDFVVMPIHIHAVLEINDVGAPLVGALESESARSRKCSRATTRVAPTLGSVIGAFKSLTTVQYVRGIRNEKWPEFEGRLWQRNYHEHIVRNDDSLDRIRAYILGNPANWALDVENPSRMA